MEKARRVSLDISIDGHSISDFAAPYLLDFEYSDNASGKADEIQLTLHDRDGKFHSDWMPKKGMEIKASIICESWESPGEDIELPCGSFKIDEIDFSGPPDRVQIKAVSSELCGPLRDTHKTRGWENTQLETVASQIASENNLELLYYGPAHNFERQDQRNESDLAFLNRIATDNNMNCKTHDGKLILFDAEQAEKVDTSFTIVKTGAFYSPISWSFKASSSGTDYSDAEVAYTDPKTGTTHTAKVASTKKTNSVSREKTLTIQRRAENAEQAAKLGKSELRKKNAGEQTASLELMGCPGLAAGQTIELADFGSFSGKYFIKSVKHKLTGGYTTSLELTTPAPSEVVQVGNELNEAAQAVKKEESPVLYGADRKNEKVIKDARARFLDFVDSLPESISDLTELLLCLPDIAEAEEKSSKDQVKRQAWKYLKECFYLWFSKEANDDPNRNEDVMILDWQWLLENKKILAAYESLNENLFNEEALKILCEKLKKKGLFTNKIESFNFISENPRDWRKYEHQYRTVDSAAIRDMIFNNLDGQEIALGKCMLYGLASGIVVPLGNNKYSIRITRVAIVLLDSFNFEGRYTPLGFWSCAQKRYFRLAPGETNMLFNWNFNNFRDAYKRGSDFLVIGEPVYIDDYAGKSYDITL